MDSGWYFVPCCFYLFALGDVTVYPRVGLDQIVALHCKLMRPWLLDEIQRFHILKKSEENEIYIKNKHGTPK